MQIGADIYLDTNMIAQALERLYPSPSLFPLSNGQNNAPLALLLTNAMDKLFFGHVVPQMDWSSLPIEFLKDRAELRGGSREDEPKPLDPTVMTANAQRSRQQLLHFLAMIERQLASSATGWFLGTATPHYADFQLYAPVQFVHQLRKLPGSGVAEGFDGSVFPEIWKWHAALESFCENAKHAEGNLPITPEAALEIAKSASRAGIFAPTSTCPGGATPINTPSSIGINSEDNVSLNLPNMVEGTSTGAELNAFGGNYSVMRETGEGWKVQVHFPGVGFYHSVL